MQILEIFAQSIGYMHVLFLFCTIYEIYVRSSIIGGGLMGRFIKYVFLSGAFILILFLGLEIQTMVKKYAEHNFDYQPYITFTLLFPILMGMLLRLPQLVKEIVAKKRWSIDWIKLLTLGVPTIYIALIPLPYFSNIHLINHTVINKIFLTGFTGTTIAGIVFGYVLIDSLKEK